MTRTLNIDVITIFPKMLQGIWGESMMKRAETMGLVRFHALDLRDFTHDKHRCTDDRPYGGGPGMLMKPEPLFEAVESIRRPNSRVILTSPQGVPFQQKHAEQMQTEEHLIFICGHYEGIDERVREALVTDEFSIGDYVLTHGILPAAVMIDATVRLLPGVLGAGQEGTECETFSSGLLEGPQYTRPPVYRDMEVPAILRSGDHQAITAWKHEQALQRTREYRPDLLDET